MNKAPIQSLRLLMLLAILFLSGTGAGAQSPSESLVFEERVFNFGTIDEANGKVTHRFRFRNKGKAAVKITTINTGCGCLVQQSPQKAISPGASGEITITLDPAYKDGFFSKEIVVLSEEGARYNRIWMEGTIRAGKRPVEDEYPYSFGAGLHLRFKVLAFGYVTGGATKTMVLPVANESGKTMHLKFESTSATPGLSWQQSAPIGADGRTEVTFTVRMPEFSNQDLNYTLFPVVNGKRLKEPVIVRVLNEANAGKHNQTATQ